MYQHYEETEISRGFTCEKNCICSFCHFTIRKKEKPNAANTKRSIYTQIFGGKRPLHVGKKVKKRKEKGSHNAGLHKKFPCLY